MAARALTLRAVRPAARRMTGARALSNGAEKATLSEEDIEAAFSVAGAGFDLHNPDQHFTQRPLPEDELVGVRGRGPRRRAAAQAAAALADALPLPCAPCTGPAALAARLLTDFLPPRCPTAALQDPLATKDGDDVFLNWSLLNHGITPIHKAYRNMDWKTYVRNSTGRREGRQAMRADRTFPESFVRLEVDSTDPAVEEIPWFQFDDLQEAVRCRLAQRPSRPALTRSRWPRSPPPSPTPRASSLPTAPSAPRAPPTAACASSPTTRTPPWPCKPFWCALRPARCRRHPALLTHWCTRAPPAPHSLLLPQVRAVPDPRRRHV